MFSPLVFLQIGQLPSLQKYGKNKVGLILWKLEKFVDIFIYVRNRCYLNVSPQMTQRGLDFPFFFFPVKEKGGEKIGVLQWSLDNFSPR